MLSATMHEIKAVKVRAVPAEGNKPLWAGLVLYDVAGNRVQLALFSTDIAMAVQIAAGRAYSILREASGEPAPDGEPEPAAGAAG